MDALKGIVTAAVASFFIALLFAYLFRLPIPLGGYIGPFGEFSSYSMGVVGVLQAVFIAWVFYGIFGGFIVLPLCGAITGVVVGRKYSGSDKKNKMNILWTTTITFIPIFILSILDYIIGPW